MIIHPNGWVMDIAIDYRTKVEADQKVRRCKSCMTTFGVEASDGSYLDIGVIQVTVLKGNCRHCGYPVTWYSTDRYIERIKKARR